VQQSPGSLATDSAAGAEFGEGGVVQHHVFQYATPTHNETTTMGRTEQGSPPTINPRISTERQSQTNPPYVTHPANQARLVKRDLHPRNRRGLDEKRAKRFQHQKLLISHLER